MSVASVQAKSAASLSNAGTVTLDSHATAGNLIVVYGVHSYSGCPPTISNSEASTVATRISDVVAGLPIRVCTMVVGATGTYTVTASMGCGLFRALTVEEVTGADVADPIELVEYAIAQTASLSTMSIGPIDAVAGAGVRALFQQSLASYTPDAGWTAPLDNNGLYLLQGKVSAGAAESTTIGLSNGSALTVTGLLFSIKPAAGGGSSSYLRPLEGFTRNRFVRS